MDPISIGIAAASSLFKGITGFFSGNSQAKAMKAAARQAGDEAGVAAQGALAQGDAAAAQGAVQAAANGGGLVGSSLGVIQMLSQRAMFNARAAAYRGVTEQQTDLYNARVAKAKATTGLISSVFGAAGDIAGGMSASKIPPAAAAGSVNGGAGEDPPY